MNQCLVVCSFLVIISSCPPTKAFLSSQIPDLLLKCYSWEGEFVNATETPPLNVALLVELLRKIEMKEITAENIRMLTAILTNRYFLCFF